MRFAMLVMACLAPLPSCALNMQCCLACQTVQHAGLLQSAVFSSLLHSVGLYPLRIKWSMSFCYAQLVFYLARQVTDELLLLVQAHTRTPRATSENLLLS